MRRSPLTHWITTLIPTFPTTTSTRAKTPSGAGWSPSRDIMLSSHYRFPIQSIFYSNPGFINNTKSLSTLFSSFRVVYVNGKQVKQVYLSLFGARGGNLKMHCGSVTVRFTFSIPLPLCVSLVLIPCAMSTNRLTNRHWQTNSTAPIGTRSSSYVLTNVWKFQLILYLECEIPSDK